MKLHLTYFDATYRAGFTNVDQFLADEHHRRGPIDNLDWLVDNGEASEIVAYQVIDHYQFHHVERVIGRWASKLAVGGVLTVVGTDLYIIVDKLRRRGISIEAFNREIYGSQDGLATGRQSTSSLMDVSNWMRSAGLNIIQQRYEDDLYVVKGKRP